MSHDSGGYMTQFYVKEHFKLFPCNLDKSSKVKWRSTENHISANEAEDIMSRSGYIGAWLPKNYIVIDIDVIGGKHKVDGMQPFIKLCEELNISTNLMNETLVVKTGSGGLHLYFKLPPDTDYRELSQKSFTEGLDIRTHMGYVIASGTSGYSVFVDKEPMILPLPLLEKMKRKSLEKATAYTPTKELPVTMLSKVLSKIDIEHFNTNDSWQEMITACIATSGNSEQVLDILEEWSKSDPSYAHDSSIRKRIETFEPDGAITAGTFIHILKSEEISKYMIDRVRMTIGAQFDFSEQFIDSYDESPFKVDYSLIHEHKELMKAFYYTKHQTAGLTLFTKLVSGNLLYVENEKRFYYFNGSRWIEATGVYNVLFIVLMRAGQRFYTDVSKKDDADEEECWNSYMAYIGGLAVQQKLEGALKQHPDIYNKDAQWDAPELEATLTLNDSVMDFSDKQTIIFRTGRREEYRRKFIDLKEKDFADKSTPDKFKEFLKDVFQDVETRKTATYALSTMLSGTGKFRKFQIWNGSGNNGKSALMQMMMKIIGDRAETYTPSALLSADKKGDSLTPELATLRGALVAFSSETDEAKRISEGAIKNLTGNETVKANPKYQGNITFQTTFQLVLSTNFLPTFSAHDNAFVNRLLILPFQTCFYDSEKMKLAAEVRGAKYFKEASDIEVIKTGIFKERAQILYYLAKRYQELGHTIPESPACEKAKSHYIKDNNGVVDMIEEMLIFDDTMDYFTPTKDIVDYYNAEQNSRYSSRFIVSRIKEVYPLVDNHSKRIRGKLTRGLKHIRLIFGAYPEGYDGNYTEEERQEVRRDGGGF